MDILAEGATTAIVLEIVTKYLLHYALTYVWVVDCFDMLEVAKGTFDASSLQEINAVVLKCHRLTGGMSTTPAAATPPSSTPSATTSRKSTSPA